MSAPTPSDEEILVKTQEIMKSVGIPSSPKILLQLNVEMRNEQVDLGVVGDIVSRDVGLTARVLKIANSPLFGSRVSIDSIAAALTRLGLRNFRNAVMAGSLRECMGEKTEGMEKFWAHSEVVASLAQKTAQTLCPSIAESSYLAGLFHDCGVPLMLKKFPSFTANLDAALQPTTGATDIEEAAFGTNHAAAGFLMAKTWQLAPSICEAVRIHHVTKSFSSASPEARMLVGVVQLAERIAAHRLTPQAPLFAVEEAEVQQQIFEALQLNNADLKELVSEMTDWLSAKS